MSCAKSFLKGERHVFSQMAGGGEGGGGNGGGEGAGAKDHVKPNPAQQQRLEQVSESAAWVRDLRVAAHILPCRF